MTETICPHCGHKREQNATTEAWVCPACGKKYYEQTRANQRRPIDWPLILAGAAVTTGIAGLLTPYYLLGYLIPVPVLLAIVAIIAGERRFSLLAMAMAAFHGWAIHDNAQKIAAVQAVVQETQDRINVLKEERARIVAESGKPPEAFQPPENHQEAAAKQALIAEERKRLMRLKAEKEAELAEVKAKEAHYRAQADAAYQRAEQHRADTAAKIEDLKRRSQDKP